MALREGEGRRVTCGLVKTPLVVVHGNPIGGPSSSVNNDHGVGDDALYQEHPMANPDGDVDMAGLDEAGNAYVPVAQERILEAVGWLVEETGEGHVKARRAEPIRVLWLLQCANRHMKEESQTRRTCE